MADYSRFIFAFLFVVLLMWALAFMVRRMGLDKKIRGISGDKGRLAVVDVLYLDPRRKLMLVRADAREYLLMVAGDNAQVVDRFEVKS